MSSIRSVLIRTAMSNIQKEISQLEHWLTNLPDALEPTIPSPSQVHINNERDELAHISRVIDHLSQDVSNQQFTLNNILNRLDVLEGFSRPDREIFIDEIGERERGDPWIDDDCQPLQNEVIGDNDDISEPLYTIRKKGVSAESSVGTPSIIPDVPEDRSIPPEIDSDTEDETETEPEKMVYPPTNIRITKEKEVVEAEEEEEETEEEEAEEEVEVVEETAEEEVEEVVEETSEEEEAEEEEEETTEEEEEGLELEEIEYKGTKYYKDAENFIYTIDDEDQPSENPVGYWKEKAQTIAFYKTK